MTVSSVTSRGGAAPSRARRLARGDATRGFVAAGLVALAFAWGVAPWLGLPPFTGHMISHLTVVAVAAPLLAFGLSGTRLDVPGRRGWSPIALSMLELAAVWGWHTPALHRLAREHLAIEAIEQLSFLLAGLLLFLAALGGGGARGRQRAIGAFGALVWTAMHMTLLGALLALGTRVLYDHPSGCDPVIWPLMDQQLGGALMIVVAGASYAGVAMWIAARALRTEAA